jgi:hypothetical protein
MQFYCDAQRFLRIFFLHEENCVKKIDKKAKISYYSISIWIEENFCLLGPKQQRSSESLIRYDFFHTINSVWPLNSHMSLCDIHTICVTWCIKIHHTSPHMDPTNVRNSTSNEADGHSRIKTDLLKGQTSLISTSSQISISTVVLVIYNNMGSPIICRCFVGQWLTVKFHHGKPDSAQRSNQKTRKFASFRCKSKDNSN